MSDQEDDKIQQYRREQLEPEIIAMSVEIEGQENPTLIVNIDDPGAKKAIKKVIVWLGLLTGGVVEWATRSTRRQIAVALAGTATIATATAVATGVLDQPRTTQPPAVIERTITMPAAPPMTVTTSPPNTTSPSYLTMPPTVDATRVELPPERTTAVRHPTGPVRTSQAEPSPTRAPTLTHSAPPMQSSPPFTENAASAEGSTETGVADTQSDEPDPTPGPPVPTPQPEPTVTGAERDCAIEVDLGDLLDLCVLS
jgi:hypothetical protein